MGEGSIIMELLNIIGIATIVNDLNYRSKFEHEYM